MEDRVEQLLSKKCAEMQKEIDEFARIQEILRLGESVQVQLVVKRVVVKAISSSGVSGEPVDPETAKKFAMTIDDLDLSIRAHNCLVEGELKIGTVGDLVKYSEADLLRLRHFGRTSLRDVKRKLEDIGLGLKRKSAGE
jgi:DNA-directed RNA polymerase alpha subunit